MSSRKDFDTKYDEVIETLCKPYKEFFKIGASVIPKDVGSVCDLGIGSGNFSIEVERSIPGVEIHGIDLSADALENARVKIPGVNLYQREFFDGPLPKTDYVISSLATHHFSDAERLSRFEQIARNGRGFVNFDMFLMNGNSLDDSIDILVNHTRKYYDNQETLDAVAHEVRENDNVSSLDEQSKLFRDIGMEFEILAEDAPWVVYHAFWPSKNL